MWETLANDPWPIFGVLFAIACLAAWWSRRTNSKPAFLAALLLLIASIIPLFAGLFVDSPVKQVERLVNELTVAGEARDYRKIADALDPNYDDGQFTKERLAQLIEKELTNFRPDFVSVSHLVIETKKSTGAAETATASFRISTGGKYDGQGISVVLPRYLVQLKLHLVKRDGKWRVSEIHRYDPQLEQEQEIPLRSK
jgi:hypothetical protein